MAKTIQQRFSQGELDPKMLGRSDIDQYYGAAETMENVVVLTQGGFRRRGGLEHIDECLRQLTFESAPTIVAHNGGTTANANDRNILTTVITSANIGTTNPYSVLQYDLGSQKTVGVVNIYNLALTSGGTTSGEFYLQGSNDTSTWDSLGDPLTFSASASADYSRRVEDDYRYIRLARIGSTNLGAGKVRLTDMNVYTQAAASAMRIINFEFNTEQSYILHLTDKNIAIYLDGVLQFDLHAEELTSARLADITWAQSADTLIIFHEDFNPQRVERQEADDYWTIRDLEFDEIPKHAFTQTEQTGAVLGLGTMTPSATTGTITLTFSSGTLPGGGADTVGQYFEGNGGRVRVLSVVTSVIVNAYVEIPFFSAAAIANTDYTYISGYENTWSSTRGWPICGTFHDGRLWIGGSKQRPTTVWGSIVGLFFDFSLGTQFDDEGIEVTLDTDQLNRIVNIYSGRNLMIFTSGAEFIALSGLNEPLTPGNISIVRQTRIGSERGLRVQEIEGGVFYIQNGGQSIQEFIFSDTQQAYVNNLISLLSNHLVQNPVDMALRRATSVDDGAYLALVQEDGEATIATIQRSQNIAAFCNQTTDGTFLATGADYNDLYFGVQRNGINYLERINDDHFLDASVRTTSGLPATVFSGLDHLNGEECRVMADDSVLANVTPSGGSATISRAAEDYCEIGLWFAPLVKDLPAEFPEQKTVLGRLLNIAECTLRLYQTSSIKINGQNLSFRNFGGAGTGSPLDSPPPQFTGLRRIMGLRGWDDTAQIEITQDTPGRMTVLALSTKILMSG